MQLDLCSREQAMKVRLGCACNPSGRAAAAVELRRINISEADADLDMLTNPDLRADTDGVPVDDAQDPGLHRSQLVLLPTGIAFRGMR